MENFIVSARKYRPQTFDTVVGQTHITSTLKNAIRTGHVAQAYLFCGPRGVGKTTCARILAKTINCFSRTENIEACDRCDSCQSFHTGHSLNIYELDAASNNSVEDIRNLISQVSFAPQIGSHKVYIIDEVHMLSQGAFNAFLKTLEEPPRHAIFILATTEKHKIIPTILSRCQIFDFGRIRTDDIVNHLAGIAEKENVHADNDALHIIAQKVDGSMRDALSIFDQMVTLSEGKITYQLVIDNLNILDYDYYFKVTDAFLEKNSSASFLLFNEILAKGFDGHHFLNGLAGHFRNLLICRDEITLPLMEVSPAIRERYKIQSKETDTELLLRGLTVLQKADAQYKTTRNQRLLVELALLQLCSLKGIPNIEKKNEIAGTRVPVTENTFSKQYTAPTITPPKAAEPVTAPYRSTSAESRTPVRKNMLSIFSGAEEPSGSKTDNKIISSLSAEKKTLESAWHNFAESIKKKNKINLYSTLTAGQPVQENDSTVRFHVLNHLQEDEIGAVKPDLLAFLRKELSNPSLDLKIQVAKSEVKQKPFTAQEKYQYLAEKNPALHNLRQKLFLEIDF